MIADVLIISLIAAYSVFILARLLARRRKGCCSGGCTGCTGCSASSIERLIREAQAGKGRM